MPADAAMFGSYVLLRRVARGGMAEVFLARQQGPAGFDRRVAVKRILPNLASSSDFVRMFLAEAKHAAQLNHPNIVHIYEFGKVGDDYFIAMEFVEGIHAGQLWKYGEHDDLLPPALVARIGADAAAALHHAHEQRTKSGQSLSLIHRDVSPANLMISFDGVVKLCDFGIAKAVAATDQLTRPGEVKGKYGYMSPEQCTAKALDGRSDVFSLCIVLWELLAARHCVPRGDAVHAMRMIRDGKLEPISQAMPSCPRALAKAITWGMETNRENRPTAAELAHALEEVIKSSPQIATPMQLGAWIRQRHARPTTEEMPQIGSFGELGVSESLARVDSASHQSLTPSGLSGMSFTPSSGGGVSVTPSSLGAAPILEHDGTEIRETVLYERSSGTDKLAPNSTLPDATVFDQSLTPSDPSHPQADAPTVIADDHEAETRRNATMFHAGSPPANLARPSNQFQRVPTPTSGIAPGPTSPASRPPTSHPVTPQQRIAHVPINPPVRALTAAPVPRGPGARVRALLGIEPREPRRLHIAIYGGLFVGVALLGVALAFLVNSPRGAPTGRLTVRTRPPSEVFENNVRLGTTPLDSELPAGPHTLDFRNPSHPRVTRQIQITEDQTTEIDFALPE